MSHANKEVVVVKSVTAVMEPAVDPRKERKAQICFICKVYVISIVLLALATTQWTLTTADLDTAHWLQTKQYLYLPWMLIGFFTLLLYLFFYNRILSISRFLITVSTLITMELNTIIFMRPMLTASQTDIIYSAIATTVIIIVFFLISLIKHAMKTKETELYAMWTARLFAASELGLPAMYAFRSVYMDLIFVCSLLFFYVVFLIYFNISMGSKWFMQTTAADYLLFSTLNYFNLLAVFCHIIMLNARLHKVM